PVAQPAFEVYLTSLEGGEAKRRISLRPDQSQPGLYEGYFTPPETGRYRMEASEDDRMVSNATEFQVTEIRQELMDTAARPERLQRISELTGGASLEIGELSSLPSLLEDRLLTTTIRSERPLWDNGLVAFLVIALLGIEWIFRRKYDLP
ncbi:MAG: hypothetical protein VW622_14025, partial [Opitutae bacterium]